MNKDNQKIKYFQYCRKSTDETDRQVLSLTSQDEEAMRKFGNLAAIKLPHESVSAFEPYKRPVFANMIERIEKGEAQGIIAWHPFMLTQLIHRYTISQKMRFFVYNVAICSQIQTILTNHHKLLR